MANSPIAGIAAAPDHQPALSHAIIQDQDGLATKMIYPPTDTWTPDQLREMGIAYFDHEFFNRLRGARSDQAYLSQVISEAIIQGEGIAIEKYTDDWYHFLRPEDLQATIRYNRVN